VNNIFENLIEALKEKNITISCIESFTGGLFSESITSVSGSSNVFVGGLVTYQTRTKYEILGVNKEIIDKYGVVSKEVSVEMAKKGKEFFKSDICVSFTGNAGPTVCEDNKQVGECYSTININGKLYINELTLKNKSRDEVRVEAVNLIAKKIFQLLGIKFL